MMDNEKIYSWIKSNRLLIGIITFLGALVYLIDVVLEVVVWVIDKVTPNVLSIGIVIISFFGVIICSVMWYRQRWMNRLRKKEEDLSTLKSKFDEKTKQYDELVKECKKEEVSKEHFEEFKTITLGFESFFDSKRNPLESFLEEVDVTDSHLSRVQTPLAYYIGRSFRYFKKRLEIFDGTKEGFELLIREFENIFFAYEDLFVTPLNGRRDDIARDAKLKERFNRFVADYEHRKRKYVDYGEKMNRLFKSQIIKTNFNPMLPL